LKASVKWLQDASFEGQSGSGHRIVMDGPPEAGGTNSGIRPMEMVLLGVGGCTAFDVMLILKKSRQQVEDCVVELKAQRAESEPKVFTHIHIHFVVTGKNLSEKHVKRAIELSAEKYCSASIMLKNSVEITHDYEIHEPSKMRGS